MYPCQIGTWTWRQVGYVFGAIQTGRKHCQPGAIDNGTLALLNGTCILFPEMRPIFEQKSCVVVVGPRTNQISAQP